VFSNTKIVKSVVEDTFNSGMGNQSNIKIDSNSNMAINIVSPRVLWVDFTGKKWSDL
jgi:hypothetical protein